MSITMVEEDTISAKIPADQKQRIRVQAAENGMTMSQYLREIIEEHFEELEE